MSSPPAFGASADLRILSTQIDDALARLVAGREFREQPDARAFGGFVEAAILSGWPDLCAEWRVAAREHPGRRTIYDASFVRDGTTIGVDFRTKDLASGRYSDGGICAVGNLLRWLVNERSILLITELGYTIEDGVADFTYVATAPIHAFPMEAYRIENLGTGQLRLNTSVSESMCDIAWERPLAEFFAAFARLSMEHYQRVRTRAATRIESLEAFVASDFAEIRLK